MSSIFQKESVFHFEDIKQQMRRVFRIPVFSLCMKDRDKGDSRLLYPGHDVVGTNCLHNLDRAAKHLKDSKIRDFAQDLLKRLLIR